MTSTLRSAGRLRSAVPSILASAGERLPVCADRASVLDVHVTSTGLAIAILGRRRPQPCVVIKLALTPGAAAGLLRESQALAAIHAAPGLASWRTLVPRRLAEGAAGGQRYAVDSALPGAPAPAVMREAPVLAAVQEGAAEAIAVLHRRTASEVAVDDALADRWIARPASLLAAGSGRRGRLAVHGLADHLAAVLHGRTLPAGWVHGDFWPGNLLVGPDGALSGIVDWDAAAGRELPLHDVLHLLLYTRRLVWRAELGPVVLEWLRDPAWTARERRVLRAYGGEPADGLPEREALLLYWLRQTAAHARQHAGAHSPRFRVWRLRNVDSVLAAL